MANNTIQIKRSPSTAAPSTLNPGELAYSNAVGGTGVLYIGSTDGATVVPIAGVRNPGTLTANQALVANSTSGINKVYAANVQVNFIEANGAGNTGTATYVLTSGGSSSNVYWANPFGGGAGFVNTAYSYTFTNVENFSNTLNITLLGANGAGNTGTAGYVLVSGGASTNAYWANPYSGGSGFVNTAYQYAWTNTNTWFANLQINATALAWIGNTTTSPTVSFANSGVIQSGNSSVTAAPQLVIANTLGTTTVNSNYISTTTIAANVTGAYVNVSGQVNTATLYATTSANIATYFIANSSGITSTGNTSLSGGVLTANSLGVYSTVGVNTTSYTVGSNFIANSTTLTFTGANTTISGANVVISGTNTYISSNVTLGGASISGTSTDLTIRNATVSGNLIVSGSVTSINVATLQVNDNIIELADNNTTTDTVDTGWYAPAGNSTSIWYSGLVRQAAKSSNSNPYFWLFGSNTNPNTATTVDVSSNSITGTLQAYLVPYGTGGAFVANSTVVNITANSTVSAALIANSLTLSTALAATYGGTGQSSYTTGDLLYASSTTALSKLSVPGAAANGQVLQITNNLPAYGVLDGGTFAPLHLMGWDI